ncbi:MAG: peptidyl-prolyl cis-trans isomerase [Candidatus Riflebacteria bacterium]|nr:peptidyl-prolyl cis-trans isomerase [Candidatus Riflebacteria bacterium]
MHLKKQRVSALFVFLLIGGMLVSTCFAQTPEDVLAEVGDIKITRADFDKELATFVSMANPQAAAHFATAEGKQAFLTQVAEIHALQKKAELLGYGKGEKYEAAFHEMAVGRLAVESMQSLVAAIEVSEEEAKESYEKNKASYVEPVQYHVFQITVDSAEKAAEIKKQLDAGKSFVELAKSDSIDDNKAAGGDRGFVGSAALEAEVSKALAGLKKDEVSAPIEAGKDLFLLVKYIDRKEESTKEFSAVSAQIKRDLLNEKQRGVYETEIEKLKKEMSFEMNASAAESLRKETLTEQEKDAILFKMAGKEVKVSELDEELQQIPPFIRPQILAGEGLNDFLKQFYSKYLATASVEKNFAALAAKYPELIKDAARRTVIRFLLDEKIGSLKLEDKEIEEYYNKNLAQFNTPAQMRAHHILVKEEAEAKELFAALEKEPAKFSDLAREKSICPSGKQAGGDLGMFGEGQMVGEFDDACKTSEIGKIVGPVKTQFGYHIIRVDERQPAGAKKLDEVREQIRTKLMPEKQSEAFTKLVEELKKEFTVKIYQEKL